MLLAQVALIVTIGLLGSVDPLTQTAWVATLAVIIAVLSATQDVAIDAYRRELLPDEELGFGNSVHVQAYRISSLIPGSLSLVLADNLPWSQVFWITAAFMGIGVLLSLGVREPVRETRPATNLRTAVLEPFLEYVHRRGWQSFILALAFMVLYKLGDNMATALSTPFYLIWAFPRPRLVWWLKMPPFGPPLLAASWVAC